MSVKAVSSFNTKYSPAETLGVKPAARTAARYSSVALIYAIPVNARLLLVNTEE